MMYGAGLLAQTSAVGIGIHTVCTYCGLYYMKRGLVDHNVVESVNKLQILSFFTFFHK